MAFAQPHSLPATLQHHTQHIRLCDGCAAIQYHRLFRRGPPEYHSAISENRADREELELMSQAYACLGPAGGIRSRRHDCTLCSVVADALDRTQRPDLDICFAQCRIVCAYLLRTRRGVPDGWTGRLCVFAASAETAVEDDPSSWADALAILELQHCKSPVPTIRDRVPRHRYQETHDIYAQMLACPPDILRDPRLGGRLLDPDMVSIELLRSWIKTCETEDGQTCGSANATKHDMAGRMLVIDVVKFCIVDAPPECQYVALSYCWGNTLSLKHTMTNSMELRTPGGLDNELVPLTIRDAMLLTKQLGYGYLWVDALCIIQDDPLSAQQQINHMDQIYSIAHLTIIAAAGEDSSAGIPGVRPRSRKIHQDVLHLPCGNMVTVIDGPPTYGRLRDSRWATRAWTMQERVLSPRKLIFTDTQVFWECQEGIFLEEMVLEGALTQQFVIEPAASTGHDGGTGRDLDRLSKSALRSNYCALVQAYSRRQLSYRSDALNAFVGILNAMGHAAHAADHGLTDSATDFSWGIPVDIFNRALSWEWESSSRDGANCTVYDNTDAHHTLAFPSWSWSAWVDDDRAGGKIKWFEDVYVRRLVMPEISFYLEGINGELRDLGEPWPDAISAGQFYIGGGHDRRDRWKRRFRTSNVVSTAKSDFVSNGRLHFESSVATLKIYRLDTTCDSIPSKKARSAFDAGPLDPGNQFKGIVRLRLNSPDALNWHEAVDPALWPKKRVVEPPQEVHTAMEQFRRSTAFIPLFQEILDIADVLGTARTPVFDWSSKSDDIEGPGTRLVLEADFVVIGRSVEDPKQYLRTIIVNWREGIAYRIGCAWISEDDWGHLSNREWKKVILG